MVVASCDKMPFFQTVVAARTGKKADRSPRRESTAEGSPRVSLVACVQKGTVPHMAHHVLPHQMLGSANNSLGTNARKVAANLPLTTAASPPPFIRAVQRSHTGKMGHQEQWQPF